LQPKSSCIPGARRAGSAGLRVPPRRLVFVLSAAVLVIVLVIGSFPRRSLRLRRQSATSKDRYLLTGAGEFGNDRRATNARPQAPRLLRRHSRAKEESAVSLQMSKAEREAFLAAPHVAVVSIARPGRGPLSVRVWSRDAPGSALRFVTGAESLKARLIRDAGRLSLCVQNETPP